MLLVGAGVVIGLVLIARAAGADEDAVHWLVFPFGLIGVAAMYYAGKAAHRLLSKVL